jgi:toxin-antitoxin system PIN domain toxin
MAKYLLDANVLLALAWPSHEFHEAAHRWWTGSRKRWATCALTELAFIRLSSNPVFTRDAVTPYEAATLLDHLVDLGQHEYWTDLPHLKREDFRKVSGHKQLTDLYLTKLAVGHEAKLATFDSRIHAMTTPETLELIARSER